MPQMMTHKRPARELAARALCRKDGHPEDIAFEGKPMWMSYLNEADAVLEAIGWQDGAVSSKPVKTPDNPTEL